MKHKHSLYEEMKKFQEEKKVCIIVLFVLGVIGLIFPVIPGLLLIGLAIALMSPRLAEILQAKIKRIIHLIADNLQ